MEEFRTKLLMIRLTEREWAALKDLADADRAKSVSDYVRRKAITEVPA